MKINELSYQAQVIAKQNVSPQGQARVKNIYHLGQWHRLQKWCTWEKEFQYNVILEDITTGNNKTNSRMSDSRNCRILSARNRLGESQDCRTGRELVREKTFRKLSRLRNQGVNPLSIMDQWRGSVKSLFMHLWGRQRQICWKLTQTYRQVSSLPTLIHWLQRNFDFRLVLLRTWFCQNLEVRWG